MTPFGCKDTLGIFASFCRHLRRRLVLDRSTPGYDPTFPVMPPAGVDVVITFRFTKKTSLSKQQIREDSRKAEEQYSRLTQTLTDAGLHAVGRRGEALGHLLIFVSCPRNLLLSLVKRERCVLAKFKFLYRLTGRPLCPDIQTFCQACPQRLSRWVLVRRCYRQRRDFDSCTRISPQPKRTEDWGLSPDPGNGISLSLLWPFTTGNSMKVGFVVGVPARLSPWS